MTVFYRAGFTPSRLVGLAFGLIIFALIIGLDTSLKHSANYGMRPAYAAAVTALMAIWWLSEALPIHWTACLPLVLYPALGVYGGSTGADLRDTALSYVDTYIFLYAGGMCIAAAMQLWGLHRRIALTIMRRIGTDPRNLLLGILVSTAFISFWISNSATATMMVSIGFAIIKQLESRVEGRRLGAYGMAIMLGVAYAANVGGIATKIGTATNAQFSGLLAQMGVEVSFIQFSLVGFPFVVLFLPIVWYALWRIGRKDAPQEDLGKQAIDAEMHKLGPMTYAEKVVLAVFVSAAVLWIAGSPLTALFKASFPSVTITTARVESSVAMLAAVILMVWRIEGRSALGIKGLKLVPWTSLLLLGGSFAMAEGIRSSGLSVWLGQQLTFVNAFGPFSQVMVISVATVALSAIASNVATVSVMFNIVRDAIASKFLLTALFTTSLAASCDFALPAGTPPNAIVFGTGYVSLPQMVKTGVVLDLAAAVMVVLWCWLIVPIVFGSTLVNP